MYRQRTATDQAVKPRPTVTRMKSNGADAPALLTTRPVSEENANSRSDIGKRVAQEHGRQAYSIPLETLVRHITQSNCRLSRPAIGSASPTLFRIGSEIGSAHNWRFTSFSVHRWPDVHQLVSGHAVA